jgi:hypothetical protein
MFHDDHWFCLQVFAMSLFCGKTAHSIMKMAAEAKVSHTAAIYM